MTDSKSYYFCGIGGSGMLPLAMILADGGARVAGSDRALDQGRLGDKFDWLRGRGIALFAQDGSGLASGKQVLVASAAVEDDVADVARARELGCARVTRAELLAEMFNDARQAIAVGGTSGKSTVTGMIGWILTACGRDPTIMNGAVMTNFAGADAPFASSRVGRGPAMVSEVDESDGSIALFDADIAVLNNISLDHKSLDELRALFGDFARRAGHLVWNGDDAETAALVKGLSLTGQTSFGFEAGRELRAVDVKLEPFGSACTLHENGAAYPLSLQVPGRHNIANALAALGAAGAAGVPLNEAVAALRAFTGLARRFERVGEARGVTVIDDFGHNPDKIAATLATLKAFPGRVIAFFQPHGYGPLKKMGVELAKVFAAGLDGEDELVLCDPVYFGGTTDRSVGSDAIVERIAATGRRARHIANRAATGEWIARTARPGDRIVVMGARDDSLRAFARSILTQIADAAD